MAIKFNQVILDKLHKNKTALSKKVDLSLVDDINYKFEDLEEEVSRLSYTVEEYFEEEFDKWYEAQSNLRSIYFQNSEAYVGQADVAGDKELLYEIYELAADLGVPVTNVYPNWSEHMDLIDSLMDLDKRFDDQKGELSSNGLS
tara:strand:- start:365 stop:796 length:432 start_codon:yes stop_codon:yes gene_type:complete